MCLFLSACSVTRQVPVALNASDLKTFLAEHPQENLRVSEQSGRRYWIHAPVVQGDSLVGQRGYDVPVQPLGVSLDQLAALHTTHFSWGRTGALVGATAAAVVAALAVLLSEAEAEPLGAVSVE
jgi:hypothetical protein